MFWCYFGVGGLVVNSLAIVIGTAIISKGYWFVGVIITGVMLILYNVWVLVAVWACSFNVNWKPWGYVARAIVIIALTVASYQLLSRILLSQ